MRPRPVIEETLKLLRSTIPTTIEFSEKIDTSARILGDQTQVQQVIMNLCTNAYHAMREEGGILDVSLSSFELDSKSAPQYPGLSPGPYVKLVVSDTGCGMDDATRRRIFDPYFTTKKKGEGTGLGLSMVHGIVKGHGGEITVYSEPGIGTTFVVYLPSIEQMEESATTETEQSIPRGTEHILFVDDEQSIVDMNIQRLERLGYRVTARTSSLEALELFKKQPDQFDLVITDMTMPKMAGHRFAEEVMKIRPDIPVILCTGFSEQISKEKAKAMGIKAYAMKPLVLRDMANIIRRVLDEK